MKDNRCFICKYRQLETMKSVDDPIYDAKGNSVTIPLCYTHSVELFKIGQKSFLTKHRNIFQGSFGIENDVQLMDYFGSSKKSSFY